MIADAELAAAVAGREHWRAEGDDQAVYEPPGAAAAVRVRRVARPVRRERYVATVVAGGTARFAVPCSTAAEAVTVAERTRLT